LRLSLLFKEVHDRIGSEVHVRIGERVPFDKLPTMATARLHEHYLREATYALGAVPNAQSPIKRRAARRKTQAAPRMNRARVGLFVTCLVDLVRPQVGFAAVKLLEAAGCTVEVPPAQTCCGQPAWNAGADATRATSRASGRCVRRLRLCRGAVRLLRRHAAPAYPEVLANDRAYAQRARRWRRRHHELVSFLVRVARWNASPRLRRARLLSRFLLQPARDGREGASRAIARDVEGLRLPN
jgi:hypothetical protein